MLQLLLSPVKDGSRHLPPTATSSLSLNAQMRPRPPPNRNLPPVPTDISRQHPAPILTIDIPSDSSILSGQHSFVAASSFVSTSHTSPRDRGVGGGPSKNGPSQRARAISEIPGDPVRELGTGKAFSTVNSRARSGELRRADTEKSERDIVRPNFLTKRPKSREQSRTVGTRRSAWRPKNNVTNVPT